VVPFTKYSLPSSSKNIKMGVLPEYTATTDPVKLPMPVMFHRGARVGELSFKKNTVPWPEIPEATAMPVLKVVA
jgi:hypothetical protein